MVLKSLQFIMVYRIINHLNKIENILFKKPQRQTFCESVNDRQNVFSRINILQWSSEEKQTQKKELSCIFHLAILLQNQCIQSDCRRGNITWNSLLCSFKSFETLFSFFFEPALPYQKINSHICICLGEKFISCTPITQFLVPGVFESLELKRV